MESPSEDLSQVFQDILQASLSGSDIPPEDQSIIAESINKIAKYQTGNNLFGVLQSLLEKTQAKIVFCNDNYETRFEPGNFETKKELLILCHIGESLGDYEAVGLHKYKHTATGDLEIRLVAKTSAEWDEILFHEFLHIKHFLEEQVGIATAPGGRVSDNEAVRDFASIKYSEATRTEKSDFNQRELSFFPELLNQERNLYGML